MIQYAFSRQIKNKLKENIESIFRNFKVYLNYIDVIDDEACILIQEDREDIDVDNISYPRIQRREISFGITIYVKSDLKLSDKIDNYKFLLEKALFSTQERVKLDNLCDRIDLQNIVVDRVGDKEMNIVAVMYTIKVYYQLDEQNPDLELI